MFNYNCWNKINRAIIVFILCEVFLLISLLNGYKEVNSSKKQDLSIYEFKGIGTIEKPYLISNSADLKYFSELVNSGVTFSEQYLKLTDDIDMSGVLIDPIGIFESGNYFWGVLDGNGHSISNLVINTGGNDGLFGMLGGTVLNLGIDSGFIGNMNYEGACGAISSHAASASARIINCYNKATVGGYRAGGIADNFAGIIINCWSDCNLVGEEIGGITSCGLSSGQQTFCYSTAGLNGNETSLWFECEKVTRDELYSKTMAYKLSSNCLIWFETMTPAKWLNEWLYEDGELILKSKKISYLNIVNISGLFIYTAKYYTTIIIAAVFLLIWIIFSVFIWKRRKNNIQLLDSN